MFQWTTSKLWKCIQQCNLEFCSLHRNSQRQQMPKNSIRIYFSQLLNSLLYSTTVFLFSINVLRRAFNVLKGVQHWAMEVLLCIRILREKILKNAINIDFSRFLYSIFSNFTYSIFWCSISVFFSKYQLDFFDQGFYRLFSQFWKVINIKRSGSTIKGQVFLVVSESWWAEKPNNCLFLMFSRCSYSIASKIPAGLFPLGS